jgi:hypothetical protein
VNHLVLLRADPGYLFLTAATLYVLSFGLQSRDIYNRYRFTNGPTLSRTAPLFTNDFRSPPTRFPGGILATCRYGPLHRDNHHHLLRCSLDHLRPEESRKVQGEEKTAVASAERSALPGYRYVPVSWAHRWLTGAYGSGNTYSASHAGLLPTESSRV